MSAESVLIVGATRGLGASLAQQYAKSGAKVYATCRGMTPPDQLDSSITWLPTVDIAHPDGPSNLIAALRVQTSHINTLIITAGLFHLEQSLQPNFDQQVEMYKTVAVGPNMIVSALVNEGFLTKEAGSKAVLISSEAGSIGLRHPSEGGGAYGHHASKSALNMCGKLLSLDLKEKGVPVVMLHPGFMRTEMTKGVGFDKFWDEGGAVTPDEAAESVRGFVRERVGMETTGEFWAPRGAGDIGTAEQALGKKKSDLPTPLELPW